MTVPTLALWLAGCIHTVWFPPDLNVWTTAETGILEERDRTEWTPGIAVYAPDQPPDTTTTPDGIAVASVDWGCDAANTYWAATVTTTGWVGSGTIDLIHPSPSSEEHPLVIARSDPNGAWDELRVGPLADGVDPADQVAGANTRYDCDLDSAILSFGVRIRDSAGVLLDCAVGGADPAAATASLRGIDPAVASLGGCRTVAEPGTSGTSGG